MIAIDLKAHFLAKSPQKGFGMVLAAKADKASVAKEASDASRDKGLEKDKTIKITLSPEAKREIDKAEKMKEALKSLNAERIQARTEAIAEEKKRAKAKIKELKKLFDVFKNLYVNDPKKMAKAIASLAREMQKLVKDYAKLAKESGELINERFDLPKSGEGADKLSPEQQKVRQALIDAEAVEGFGFIRDIKKLREKVKEVYDLTKLKAIAQHKIDPEKDEDFIEADEAFKELDDDLKDFTKAIKDTLPPDSKILSMAV